MLLLVSALSSRSDALAVALDAADVHDAPDARMPGQCSPAYAQDAHCGRTSPSAVTVPTAQQMMDPMTPLLARLKCVISGPHGGASPDSPPTKRGANYRQGLESISNLTFPWNVASALLASEQPECSHEA